MACQRQLIPILLFVSSIQESCANVESAIHSQCLQLIEALQRREEALVDFARRERDLQLRRLREEVATCTSHLQHTTALVQFCIEALKESDSSAFLQVRLEIQSVSISI